MIIPTLELKYNEILATNDSLGKKYTLYGWSLFEMRGATTLNYFVSKHIGLGGYVGVGFRSENPFVDNIFYRSITQYEIGPSIRYQLLNSAFTPFIEVHAGYNYLRQFYDNPALPAVVKTQYNSGYSAGASIGASYYINPRVALQFSFSYHKYHAPDYFWYGSYDTYRLGIGCTFILASRGDEEYKENLINPTK